MIKAPTEPHARRQFLHTSGVSLLGLAWASRGTSQPAPAQLPALQPAERVDGPPIVSARAWAIGDGRTGRFLWGNNESARLAMASTTKVMTAHLVLRLAADDPRVLDESITVSESAARTIGSSARIRAGDRIPVRDMLYGLLLPSGNDAAAALAEHFGPRFGAQDDAASPTDQFVRQMNRRATELQLGETRYFDPHGLGRNHTSARNLVQLGWTAMQDERFRTIVRTRRREAMVTDAQGAQRATTWNNTNRLLGIEGYEGIKTGTTTAAGACLVASGRRGNDQLFVVVLGCTSNDSRYVDTRNLFRWAWRERGQ